ncbi:ribulose-bisphosphate carboxylase large subunit family protein [Variovorax sp. NFACC27]|uniref:ribulose-bisphosphate carboxylase large subunit family protein n=1 Tax=unclassified Variovorax TaxID=663243 RepID=UPI000894AA98|nr:ribulose-bisphosphate carboxylase large chain [Variovorax sp. NFACC28]SEG84360.1 ribulose-bisphosphate carboxylase large chain [Variovorax sp. NFACC29]SFD17298.1 ribulose-bisphosphate carboxylase large chain [Variovorax sp. NFACC26]SFG24799.1 ribulose-bisphosphate carboxylase large chain [Variovorax sp. NFACC27]
MPGLIRARYLIETPLDPAAVAEVMAGEQSCGTFTRVEGETDALRERARATVEAVIELDAADAPSLPNALLERRGTPGPWRRAHVDIAFPVANIGANLPTLAATVSGNLYDLGEVTGLRLESLRLPADYRARFEMPRAGIAGTRRATGVQSGALVGTIIKPNVGMRASDTAELVGRLCAAGVDFIKDDEVCADPAHAPLAERVPAVMAVVRAHRERTGKHVMVAFNITDETDAMKRHADLVEREGGSCVMASLNWCGHSGIQTLRRHTGLALHGHRNGYGALSRHPLLGISFQAYQTLWRLAGVDHMHVHGLQGKFSQPDSEVVESARDCFTPLTEAADDRVMPAFSSGQWAGTVPATWAAVGSDDLLFMAGGGILAHPDGAAAGVASIRQAWSAARAGVSLADAARDQPELARALAFFGRP